MIMIITTTMMIVIIAAADEDDYACTSVSRRPSVKSDLSIVFKVKWGASSRSYTVLRGRNSSVGSAWARCPQRHGFDPPLGTFSGRGDFSLEVSMGSNSIPPKTLSDESINRGLVCAHMHFIARTQKILTFMSLNAGNNNTPSTHHPRRRNVTTLMVGLKNGHIRKNLTQKW